MSSEALTNALNDTALLLAQFKQGGYPKDKQGISQVPIDIQRIFFQYFSDVLDLSSVCALGSCNRSLYVLHCEESVWIPFMKALSASTYATHSKINYITDYRMVWLSHFLQRVNTNLWTSAAPFIYTSDGASQTDYVPKCLHFTIDLSKGLDSDFKQLHGIGDRVYFRDDQNAYVLDISQCKAIDESPHLDASECTIIKKIPFQNVKAAHLEESVLCTVTSDHRIRVSCLVSDQAFEEFKGLESQITKNEKGYAIQIRKPHLTIGYQNGETMTWDYRTGNQITPPHKIQSKTDAVPFGNSLLSMTEDDCITMENQSDNKQEILIDSGKITGISEFVPLGRDQLLIGTKSKQIHILDFGFPYDEVYRYQNYGLSGLKDTDIKPLENTYAQLSPKHKKFLDDVCSFSIGMQLSELLTHIVEEIESENELRAKVRNAKTDEERTELYEKVSKEYRNKLTDLTRAFNLAFGV